VSCLNSILQPVFTIDRLTPNNMPKNKRRLYIAFFHRETSEAVPVKFHTAFLVTPKNPKTTDEKKNSHLYHVVNRISETGQETWVFEPKEIRSRTLQLAGVMFLGKLPPSITHAKLKDILNKVPRQNLVEDRRAWRCCDWIWDALPIMVAQGVIGSLPAAPVDVWKTGIEFTGNQKMATLKNSIPCCNTAGQKIASELGPSER